MAAKGIRLENTLIFKEDKQFVVHMASVTKSSKVETVEDVEIKI